MSWALTMDAIWGRGALPAKKLTGNSIPERRSSQGGTHRRPPVPGLSGLPRMSGGRPTAVLGIISTGGYAPVLEPEQRSRP